MKKTLILVASYLLVSTTLKSQDVVWDKSIGGTGFDEAMSITQDAFGNIYSTGFFSGTTDFDPGPGTANLTSAGVGDIFVLKMDASGNFLWAKSFGATFYDVGISISTDALGNVYTTGYFQGTVDFDPGVGNVSLTSAGGWDIFIHKMDASGNLLWVKSFGGTEYDIGNCIKVDASGNVYTTGNFIGTVDFDPGPGTTNLTAEYRDNFVLKIDASGNLLWAKCFGTSSVISNDGTNTICMDASGNVYTTGCFKGTGDFDPGTGTAILTSAGGYEVFVQKMDSSGNFLWAKSFGGTTGNDRGTFSSVDALGNVYTTGRFEGTGDFDPGTGIAMLTSAGLSNIFVQKMDPSGNFLWAKSFGSVYFDEATSIIVDSLGNVYTTGNFAGTVDFDPGGGTAILTSTGESYDFFVQNLDSSGNFLWAKIFGGTGSDRANSISLDASGNLYTAGRYQGTEDFDLGSGATILTSAFMIKMNSNSLPIGLMYFYARRIDRGIELSWATGSEINNKFFVIERSSNGIDWETVKKILGTGNSSRIQNYHTTDDRPIPGTSYYRLKQIDLDGKYFYSDIQVVRFEEMGSEVSIYPNPSKGKLWVDFEKEIKNVELIITDLQGKIIYKKTYNTLSNTTFNQNIPKGVYLLTIKTPQGQTTKKIVKE